MEDKKETKILLVEDDQLISRAYKEGLTMAGLDVIVVHDGVEASDILAKESFDLVLLDLILPRKNGFEVLEEMKESESLKDIPVIVLSNLGREADVQRCKDFGVHDYLIKSNFSMKEIIDKVKELIAKQTS